MGSCCALEEGGAACWLLWMLHACMPLRLASREGASCILHMAHARRGRLRASSHADAAPGASALRHAWAICTVHSWMMRQPCRQPTITACRQQCQAKYHKAAGLIPEQTGLCRQLTAPSTAHHLQADPEWPCLLTDTLVCRKQPSGQTLGRSALPCARCWSRRWSTAGDVPRPTALWLLSLQASYAP